MHIAKPYGLNRYQAEPDFIDVPPHTELPVFDEHWCNPLAEHTVGKLVHRASASFSSQAGQLAPAQSSPARDQGKESLRLRD